MQPLRVAILGAPGTGKSTLALALQAQSDPTKPLQIHDNPSRLDLSAPWGLVLLMGLDLPTPAAAMVQRQHADQQLRSLLAHMEMPHTLVYGSGPARTQCALQAIDYALGTPRVDHTAGPWKWNCDKCSDADCEHRLFRDLIA